MLIPETRNTKTPHFISYFLFIIVSAFHIVNIHFYPDTRCQGLSEHDQEIKKQPPLSLYHIRQF